MSPSLRSCRVGSRPATGGCSVSTTRIRSPSPAGPMPPPSRRMPNAGSSVVLASAISQLVVGSHPGKPMPAAFLTALRPPSHPTR